MSQNNRKYFILLPYISFVISIFFYVHAYFFRMSITGISEYLTKFFHINAVSLSLVAATFYYAYALMQIPAGLIVDRFSPRIVVTSAQLIVTIGAIICWHAEESSELFLTRILIGLGASFAFLSILKIARTYFKEENFPFINGLTFSIGTVASILAGAPLLALLKFINWKDLVLYLSIIGFVITCCAMLFLRPIPKKEINDVEAVEDKPKQGSLKAVMTDLNLWKVALYGGFSFTFITVFAGLWLIPILKSIHPDTPTIASYGSSIMFLGFGTGALLLGKISQRTNKVKPIMVLTSLTTLCLFLIILYLAILPLFIQFILIFFLGLAVSGTTLAFSFTAKIVPPEVSGFAFSLVNVSQILISALMLPFSGYLVSLANIVHAIPKHNLDTVDYQIAMSILILSCVISLICAMRLNE